MTDPQESTQDPSVGLVLSDKVYNTLKWTALILLPGLATFYGVIGGLWDFPAIIKVVGTLNALAILMGLLIRKSAKNYVPPEEKQPVGAVIMQQNQEGDTVGMRMQAYKDPFVLDMDHHAVFEVRREAAPPGE